VIRLLPPLIMTDDEADILVRELASAVRAFLEKTTTGTREQLSPAGGRT
jgi:acetylornithine/succinyldiaminopimelate/putrescine aminotransferase